MTKIFFKQLNLFSMLVVLVTAISCTKTRNGDNNLTTAPVPGELAEISQPGFHALTFDFTTTPQTVPIYVNIASPKPVSQDVVVTLAPDPTGLADYNTANGTAYELLPSNAYLIADYKVTVKKGQNLDSLKLVIYPDKVDLSKQLALSLKLADASGRLLSKNFSNVVYSIGVKNKYDGVYDMRIKTVGWDAYGIADGLTGQWPRVSGNAIGMVTASANSVTLFDYLRSDNLQPAFTTGLAGATAFGATTPKFTFDATTNKLTSVVNTTPDDGRGRVLNLNPSVTDSRFDPATRTIYAAYIMSQNGRPDQKIYDTLTYTGPR